MASQPFVVNHFGGLNVIADPEEVGPEAAVSLLNVDTDVRGTLRTRDGYSNHTVSAAANAYRSLYFAPSGHLLGVRLGSSVDTVDAIDSGGTVVASANSSNPGGFSGKMGFASLGNLSNAFTYIIGSGMAQTWNGSAFAAAVFTGAGPTGTPNLAVWKERLAFENGGTVTFSDAGDASTYTTNNFVIPDPLDGQTATAFTPWSEYLFYVRNTKMFVWYGVDTDPSGQPIFQYRRQVFGDIGSYQGHVSASDGFYYLTTKGLYKSVGGQLALVSDQPRGIFGTILSRSIPSGYDRLPASAFQSRLYFAAASQGSSTLDRVLAFDTGTGDWLVWDIAAQSLAVSRFAGAGSALNFGLPSKHVGKLDATVTTDAGAAIAWNYTSGLYDMGEPARVKITRESTLWGSGTVTLQVANDHGAMDTGSAVTLGAAPAVVQGWQQIDREGTLWQHKLSGTSSGAVNRLAHYVSFIKPPGVG